MQRPDECPPDLWARLTDEQKRFMLEHIRMHTEMAAKYAVRALNNICARDTRRDN